MKLASSALKCRPSCQYSHSMCRTHFAQYLASRVMQCFSCSSSALYPLANKLTQVLDRCINAVSLFCRQLLELTCQVANALKTEGVKKGDRVAIYMPVSPLLAASMLACARIGAVHRWADGHSSPNWSGIACTHSTYSTSFSMVNDNSKYS